MTLSWTGEVFLSESNRHWANLRSSPVARKHCLRSIQDLWSWSLASGTFWANMTKLWRGGESWEFVSAISDQITEREQRKLSFSFSLNILRKCHRKYRAMYWTGHLMYTLMCIAAVPQEGLFSKKGNEQRFARCLVVNVWDGLESSERVESVSFSCGTRRLWHVSFLTGQIISSLRFCTIYQVGWLTICKIFKNIPDCHGARLLKADSSGFTIFATVTCKNYSFCDSEYKSMHCIWCDHRHLAKYKTHRDISAISLVIDSFQIWGERWLQTDLVNFHSPETANISEQQRHFWSDD
jgi:hypothetical protein